MKLGRLVFVFERDMNLLDSLQSSVDPLSSGT